MCALHMLPTVDNLYDIGEFYPHMKFLREDCGYDGDPGDILLTARS